MSHIVRYITADGAAVITAIDSTGIVARAEQLHKTSAVVTAALGRLLTAASMMGYLLKDESDTLTLQVKGNGPVGAVVAVSDSHGNVRGYAGKTVVEIPLNAKGKLDVSGAVGKDGMLYVMRDFGEGEPYVGQVPLVSGEIAEDITSYYATSEQTPTVCGLGVLVAPDLTVQKAGGFLLQLLPYCPEETIAKIEENVASITSVTGLLSEGKTPSDICEMLFAGLEPNLLDEGDAEYRCDCTRERVEHALLSIGEKQLRELVDEGKTEELLCHFCNKRYRFSPDEIRKLLETAVRAKKSEKD